MHTQGIHSVECQNGPRWFGWDIKATSLDYEEDLCLLRGHGLHILTFPTYHTLYSCHYVTPAITYERVWYLPDWVIGVVGYLVGFLILLSFYKYIKRDLTKGVAVVLLPAIGRCGTDIIASKSRYRTTNETTKTWKLDEKVPRYM